MKIIKTHDPKRWDGAQCRCTNCDSILLVEADDLIYTDKRRCATSCAVCKALMYISDEVVPKYVIAYVKAKSSSGSGLVSDR